MRISIWKQCSSLERYCHSILFPEISRQLLFTMSRINFPLYVVVNLITMLQSTHNHLLSLQFYFFTLNATSGLVTTHVRIADVFLYIVVGLQ